ncbi:MAG: hypothetical protein LBU65_13880 [Planctomycetaceae bacterium]|jgi:hypothetical protein|nr:hypothetical protein [Planctomycetaceae bacterium]
MIYEIDPVEMVRKIRDELYNEIKDLPREEQIKFVWERTGRAVAAHEEWRKNYYAEKNKTTAES